MVGTKIHLVEVRTGKDAAATAEAMDIMSAQSAILECINDSHARVGTNFVRLPTDGNTKGGDRRSTIQLQCQATSVFSTKCDIEGLIAKGLGLPGIMVAAKAVKQHRSHQSA